MKIDNLMRSMYISEKYKSYIRSSFNFGNRELQSIFDKTLKEEELFKGPYLDLILPFKQGKTINELIEDGILCKKFGELSFGETKEQSELIKKRPLYAHQEQAIKLVGEGRSIVVTTGTGSGKTESFLFPILNSISKEIEEKTITPGMRALFLYPMNALVNDQMDRMRGLLKNSPDITYAFFTGDTPENGGDKIRLEKEKEGIYIPANEYVSREEIRKNPPNILITNYSMLEYLLIRPSDFVLFQRTYLNKWKYVVLDEAHTYSGTQGIEVSMLLKRLTALAPRRPQFILTSATLGKQGESEGDILDFAYRLTSSSYRVSDIIFASRIALKKSGTELDVPSELYPLLYNNLTDIEAFTNTISSYISERNDVGEMLYELLSRDKNVFKLYKILLDGPKSFQFVYKEFKNIMGAMEFCNFIDLINNACKKGRRLFELKYHSFVRPLAGAYITLTKPYKLTLNKTKRLDDYRTFELGNCIYCREPYLIGKIVSDGKSTYLIHNDEVDLYETHDEYSAQKIDYFIFDKGREELEESRIESMDLCCKCGRIVSSSNLNKIMCECGSFNKRVIYKVNMNEESESNNLSECPCCGNKTSKGIVKNLNLGKDEGTALIAQFLFDSTGSEEKKIVTKGKLSFKSKKNAPAEDKLKTIKQFLTFSDSRQQASFHAVFFDDKNVKILMKRLMWEVIKNNDFEELSLLSLKSRLEDYIRTNGLFDYVDNKDKASVYNMDSEQKAWATILTELLKIDGGYSAEGLGLYHFELKLDSILENFNDEDIEESFGQYNIDKKDLENLIQVLFSVFRITPAIDYVDANLSIAHRRELLDYRSFSNSISLKLAKNDKNVRSFIPINQKNSLMNYVMKVCKCDSNQAKEIMELLFEVIGVEGELFEPDSNIKSSYRIKASKYTVKNYKKVQYYQCDKCGTVTPFNVHNCCVKDTCEGKINPIDPDVAFSKNYYRESYMNKQIDNIIIKEHTAMLSREKGRLYAEQFKAGKINILSCSTTFEMGIDLGSLDTVFMRNVPPTPANYVQRAGRAGRRAGSSAYVLTYCGTNSHDYTYFENPEKMISGRINAPRFETHNEKIIKRHLMSASLGFYFRNRPEEFRSVSIFIFDGVINTFKEYLESEPEDLKEYLDDKVLIDGYLTKYREFRWYKEKGEYDISRLDIFEDTIRSIVREYDDAMQTSIKEEKYKEADYFKRQIEAVKGGRILDALSKYCVIPKYGFPVDVVELEIYRDGKKLIHDYDITRDLKIAISEYAPGSEIIVDGVKYVSRYITKPRTHEFARHYFYKCDNCGTVNVRDYLGKEKRCKSCGERLEDTLSDYFIEPIYGFKSGEVYDGSAKKPRRTYAGNVSYLGGGYPSNMELSIPSVISVRTTYEDELLIMNRSAFEMCPKCGYSLKIGKKPTSKKHMTYWGSLCDNNDFEKLRIGHRFKTDVARLSVEGLEVNSEKGYKTALSFMYALLEGMSVALNIDRNDINGIVEQQIDGNNYDILIYDDVPGGAGYVKSLLDKNSLVRSLKEALNKVNQKCCSDDTSCYNCLRNYYNQSYHNTIERGLAQFFIIKLLAEIQ